MPGGSVRVRTVRLTAVASAHATDRRPGPRRRRQAHGAHRTRRRRGPAAGRPVRAGPRRRDRRGAGLRHGRARHPVLPVLGDQAVRRIDRVAADRGGRPRPGAARDDVVPGVRRQRQGGHHAGAGDAAHVRLPDGADGPGPLVGPGEPAGAHGRLAAQLGAGDALRVPPDRRPLGARRAHRGGDGDRLPGRRARARHRAPRPAAHRRPPARRAGRHRVAAAGRRPRHVARS